MKLKLGSLIVSMGLSLHVFAADINGTWTTIDDKTGQKRAVVQLSEKKGILSGRIIKVYAQAGDTGRCANCPGAFKDKPVKGLRFVWGLKKKNEHQWDGGHILDPKSGKIYSAKITQNNNSLNVRGYLGISALGRSQTWVR